MVFALSR